MGAAAFPPVLSGVIGGALVRTVNGRDLHAFLKVGRDFTTWIKARIAKFGFAENADYVVVEDLSRPDPDASSGHEGVFPRSGENPGGRPATEYHLTIDMAKELSMVENNDQGRAARRYFIECERRAKAAEVALPRRESVDFPEVPVADNRMQMVAECRRIFGRRPARRLWLKLDLPEVDAERRPATPVFEFFGDTRDAWCERIMEALAAADEALDERKLLVRAALSRSEFEAAVGRLIKEGLTQTFFIDGKRYYRLSEYAFTKINC